MLYRDIQMIPIVNGEFEAQGDKVEKDFSRCPVLCGAA